MRASVRRHLRTALADVDQLIPTPWDIDRLLARIADRRDRPIQLLPWDFPADQRASGLWIPTEKADYIFYDRTATPTVREQIIGHELGHILLGHTPRLNEVPDDLLAALAPSLTPALTRRLLDAGLTRDGYEAEEEAIAEEFGTRLMRLGSTKKRPDGMDELGRLTDALW